MAKNIKVSKGVGRPRAANKLGIQAATRLSATLNEQLEKAAVKIERPPAWIMRRALEEWLDRNGFLSLPKS
jgi:predicted DNA-binding protein